MLKAQETVLEIDLKALKHNLEFIKSKLEENTKCLAVVKAFAYGSDTVEVAKCLETLNVDYFAVAYVNEGVALRDAGITRPILVLHPQVINFETLMERNLEPSLYSHRVLDTFINTVKKHKKDNYPVHIKFNTGLNRLGFVKEDVDSIVSKLKVTETIKVKSIFSHLAASEDKTEKDFTNGQIVSFKSISNQMVDGLGYKPMLHQCNTSGIMNYPEAHFDMVRCGIGLYGFGNNQEVNRNLKPVATLKTVISQIHTLNIGDSLGYNRAFVADRGTRTATLPIGHADGIGRQYGNEKGFVTINGQKASILGNVCMDMIMVDVTNIACKEGDEVVIFGQRNTAEHLAENVDSISYELLTAVSRRVKRTFNR